MQNQKKQGTWKQIYSGWPPDDAEVPITKRGIFTVIHIYIFTYISLRRGNHQEENSDEQYIILYI